MTRTIRGKLTLGLALTISILFIITFFITDKYEKVIDNYDTLTDNVSYVEEILLITDTITENVVKTYANFDGVLAEDTIKLLDELTTTLEILEESLENDGSRFIFDRLMNTIKHFDDDTRTFILYMKEGNVAFASDYRESLIRINNVISSIGLDMTKNELSQMHINRSTLSESLSKARSQFILLLVVMTGFLIWPIWHLNNGIVNNIKALQGLFRAIGQGDLNYVAPMLNSSDEFDQLMVDAHKMKNDLHELTLEKDLSRSAIVSAVGSLAEMRDNETGKHINSVKEYLSILCKALKENSKYSYELNRTFVDNLIQVSPLHDIGKVGIPDYILLKPGKLTFEEFEIMKTHVEKGQNVIHQACVIYNRSDTSYFDLAEQLIADHHEKWDGSGYPKGIAGDKISLSGRLVAIVDVYDALTTDRVYKKAYSHDKAVSIILEGKGHHFDPDLIDAFEVVEGLFKDRLMSK